jgi:hypothetical protein
MNSGNATKHLDDALVGYTGYVGSTLLRQRAFAARYRSTDIDDIRGRRFDTLVCAGAPAQKWIANRDPDEDRRRLRTLTSALAEADCRRFVLISTVDVFADPAGVDEDSPVPTQGLHAYGLHRRELELFVEKRFGDAALIVRLPGLVGPGLRKNLIYDLKHDNDVGKFDARAVFQFYPMVNLWWDIRVALDAGLRLVHLTAAPLSVAEVAREGFGRVLDAEHDAPPARYDMSSRHAPLWQEGGGYQYDRRSSLLAIRAYAQGESGAG